MKRLLAPLFVLAVAFTSWTATAGGSLSPTGGTLVGVCPGSGVSVTAGSAGSGSAGCVYSGNLKLTFDGYTWTPPQIASVVSDYACGSTSCVVGTGGAVHGNTIIRLDCGAPGVCGLTGISGFIDGSGNPRPGADGAIVTIENVSLYDETIYGLDGRSDTVDQFSVGEPTTGRQTPLGIPAGGAHSFRYDTGSQKLREIRSSSLSLNPWTLAFNTQYETNTGGINDEPLAYDSSILVLNGATSTTLFGITAGKPGQQLEVICAVGVSSPCTLSHLATGQAPGDQIVGINNKDVCISANGGANTGGGGALLVYRSDAGNGSAGAWETISNASSCMNASLTLNSGVKVAAGAAEFDGPTDVFGLLAMMPTPIAVTLNGTQKNDLSATGIGAANIVVFTTSADTVVTGVKAPSTTNALYAFHNSSTSAGKVILPSLTTSATANQWQFRDGVTQKLGPDETLVMRWTGTNWKPWNLHYELPELYLDGGQIHNVADPGSAQDAATKAYVDSVAPGAVSGTTGNLAIFSSAHVVGSFAGSGPCSAGTFVTTISATGSLTCGTAVLPAALAGTGSNLQIATGSHTIGDFAGSTCSAGTYASAIGAAGALTCGTPAGTGSGGTGTVTSLTCGAGLTCSPSTITTTGSVSPSVGTGLLVSGGNLIADISTGLALSGNHVIADLGTGVTLSGNHIIADISTGLTLSGNHVIVDYTAVQQKLTASQGASIVGTALTVTDTPIIFGDGKDGAQTFDGTTTILGIVPAASTYTLARSIFCNGCTVNSGVTIAMNNFAIYDRGTFTLAGHLTNNGKAASGATAGATTGATWFSATEAGGAAGGTTTNGTATSAVTAVFCSPWVVSSSGGGAGAVAGNGGDGTANSCQGGGGGGAATTNTGGAAGSTTIISAGSCGDPFGQFSHGIAGRSGSTSVNVGTGGGGGAGGASFGGGGGGASGGQVYLATWKLAGTGDIKSVGGAGANGLGSTGGGGGGGGGGPVIVAYFTRSGSVTLASTGGTGGTGGTGAGNGGAGGSCFTELWNLSGDGT